jgi:hypothetical protein
MSNGPAWGQPGSVSPFGDGSANGVRLFWFLLAGLAGAVVCICLAFAVAIYDGKAFRRAHRLHLSPGLVAIGIVVIGLACLLAARLLERPLDGSSDASLLASYRSRFFIWVGLGEAPFFLGLAAVAVTGWFWPCLVGAALAVLGYVRIAPTARALARDQERLNATGNSRSLVGALATMPTQTRRLG